MKKRSPAAKKKQTIEQTLESISNQKEPPIILFFIIVALYLITAHIIRKLATINGVIMIKGVAVPYISLTGVFSAVTNICIIISVVFYRKKGFFCSMFFLITQFPMVFIDIFKRHNYSSITGVFTNTFTITIVMLVYLNNVKIENYQDNLKEQAVTDRLTGLPNRYACSELISELINSGERFAVVSIDLNNFKSINDTMGHNTGNKLLIALAKRWKELAESDKTPTLDFITRQGGDEFTLIIRNCDSEKSLLYTINAYVSELERKLTIDDCDFFLSGCFGYVRYPDDADRLDTLFSYADAAMYEAKRCTDDVRIRRFTPDLMREVEHTLEIERKIRAALDNNTIYFALQPQFDINHNLRGFEALARMNDQDGNEVKPSEFIPVAEKVGLIDKVDLKVFRNSAMFFGELIRKTGTNATLSVNVSVMHMMKNNFLDEVRDIIKSSGVPANQIEIEITESIMIDSAEKALQCLDEIKNMGMKIAIDDFGTGYSSLSYLNKFPADLLKVDKSFIDKMNLNDSSRQYVAAIISIGHIMKFSVISEGVEESEQLETLKSIGCDYIQGFLWGHPLSPEDAEKLVCSYVNK